MIAEGECMYKASEGKSTKFNGHGGRTNWKNFPNSRIAAPDYHLSSLSVPYSRVLICFFIVLAILSDYCISEINLDFTLTTVFEKLSFKIFFINLPVSMALLRKLL